VSEKIGCIRHILSAAGPFSARWSTARRARVALVISALLALTFLAWNTWHQIHTRLERERALAVQATGSASAELSQNLHSISDRLKSFVAQKEALLESLTAAPDASNIQDKIWESLRLQFPHATAALILNDRGAPAAALGERLGEKKGQSLRELARGEAPPIRFAMRGEAIQVDFSASWLREGKPAGTMLLSLNCPGTCSPDPLPAPLGHSLRVSPGPLVALPGTPQTLESKTPDKALSRVPIDDTGWVLVDYLDAAYVSEIIHSRLALGLLLGAAFLLATWALCGWVRSPDQGTHMAPIDPSDGRPEMQAILSATTDGIILTDRQGLIRLFNHAAETTFGYPAEIVLNANVFKLLPHLRSSDIAARVQMDDVRHLPPVVRETRGRRKGGLEFPVRASVNLVRLDQEPLLLIVVQDLTEHVRNEQHLIFLEQRDVLTGLLNRREFERRLTAIIADPQRRRDTSHVLCHIDVDRFKLINDTCGHEAGDELLKQLAVLTKAKLAMANIIGRFGGDEFVALFQYRDVEEVREICDELTQTVRNFLFTWRDKSFDVAISIGMAEFTPECESASDAQSKADVACHMAKSRGRGRIHVYHQGDVELIRHHGDMHVVSTISQALSDGRFHLYAQPIAPIAARSGKRRHFEILVRMIDEDGALMIPDQFIPAAERYILMPDVDRWIINRLFSLQEKNLRAWHQIEPDDFLFSVNLSGTSIADEGFLHYLKCQFTDWNIPHRSICFEITETAAISDLERARDFMQELSSLGCTFALDDFGTGLSSYRYLKELPVHYLKIDGSFVRGMGEDPVNYALVESITQIGHVLGLKTIAEWTEDESTLTQLRAMNVDYAQGFGVGKLMHVRDLTLADTTISSCLGNTPDDRSRITSRPRGNTARPA